MTVWKLGVLGVGEMIAVADVAVERAKQVADELEIEHSRASLEEMVQRKDIDAVLIATPAKFHVQAIHIASAAGKDIPCEKPLATNLEDAQAAMRELSRVGVRLQIGFMRRYDLADFAAMKRVQADVYSAEVQDFVHTMLTDGVPRVNGGRWIAGTGSCRRGREFSSAFSSVQNFPGKSGC